MNRLEVPDRDAWRTWLSEHHTTETEVWLVYLKGTRAEGSISYADSVEEALCFGWIDGLVRRLDDQRYMRRFTPRNPKSTWSASNKDRVARLLKEGRVAPAGMRIIEAAKQDGSWDEVPDAEREWAMPPELEAVLEDNSDVAAIFASASPSHRRQYVMWVASAKHESTRRRRAAKAAEMLRRGEGPS